jgi:RNA polymerase primary sigma factor
LLLPAPDEDLAEHTVCVDQLRDDINKVTKTLSYREREILKMRYGLGDGYSYSLEEVGKIFGVTKETVRQIENRALRKMQKPNRSSMLVDHLD